MKRENGIIILTFSAFWILLFFSQGIMAQNDLEDDFLDHSAELFNETENQELASEVTEELGEILQEKENINIVKPEVLRKLPFLTDFQVHSFLEYRKKYGRIYSENELWLIPGFHETLIEKFIMLFDFGEYSEISNKNKNYRSPLRHKILLRNKLEYPKRKGFTNKKDASNNFNGSQLYRLVKYELKRKDKIRIGFTMENDAGETFNFDTVSRGFDFNSAFIEYSAKRFPDKIILGDYRLSSAEGLIYSYGRKGKTSMNSFKRSLPLIKKFSSTTEYGFYRGLAVQFNKNNIRAISFYSRKAEDAKIYQMADTGRYFLSVNTTGYHRNEKEKKRINSIQEESAGLISSFTNEYFQVGYNLKFLNYSPGMGYTRLGDPYTEFIVREKFLWQSVFYNLQLKKIFFSGELAYLTRGGLALQQKASINIHPLWTMNIGYRNFSPEYFCPGAASLSESSNPQNEKGLFTEIISYPFSFLKLRIYLDNYHFPWINYRSAFPLSGIDLLIATEWYILKDMDLKIYFKSEKKEITYKPSVGNMKVLSVEETGRFYTQLTYRISENFSSRNRFETKWKKETGNHRYSGILIYTELTRYLFERQLKLNLRYTVFDIPDWAVRIYSWEHDLLYAFSTTSYYKSGFNMFLNLRWKISNNYSLGMKFSSTFYTSERQSGTGPDSRSSGNYHYLKGQFIIKL